MANLVEQEVYEEGIYQLELTDKVVGGENGISNLQAKQLANRTKYLKAEVEKRVETADKGAANGVASLDENGRIPYSQLPESAMEYKGMWNAETNVPELADGTGDVGDMYFVSKAGEQDLGSGSIQFFEGDRIVYNGSVWQRLPGNTELLNKLAQVYPYIYTGRNLVEVFGVSNYQEAFAELKRRSDAGNFIGLGYGDYIDLPSLTIAGTTYTWNDTYQNLRLEIVAFDQYYRNGDTDITSHHIIMQFKNCPFTRQINDSDTNSGGWNASGLKTWIANNCVSALESAMGVTLKTIRRILSTHGNWNWLAEKVFLPSEVECVGTKAWSDNYGYTVGNCRQWGLFRVRPDRLIKFYNGARYWWWTCSDSTPNSTSFVCVSYYGSVHHYHASDSFGVPLALAI